MTKHRALSLLLDVKTSDGNEQRIIEGIATHPAPDRLGDSVDQHGVLVAETVPLLVNHDHAQVVGKAALGRPTSRGIPFVAQIPRITEPCTLRDRCESAWFAIRYKLLAAVSIGFRVLDSERMSTGGERFTCIEVLELSLVPVPAQPLATIDAVRSGSAAALATVLRAVRAADRRVSNPARDGAAFERMRREAYKDDPKLAALRARRLGRPSYASMALLGLD